jgi:hypothetical protein
VPYTLVSAPALGYDLARLPHGPLVATVVRTALHASPRHLRLLAARHTDRARQDTHASAGVRADAAMSSALPEADRALERALADDAAASSASLRRLETASLGSVESLDAFLRRDVLAWTWADEEDRSLLATAGLAADVLRDAAASAFLEAPPAWRRRMAAPFLGAGVPLADSLVPTDHPGVDEVVSAFATLDAGRREAWRDAVEECRPWTTSWAPAMHQCTWALHLTDRLHLAADAQLAGVQAFRSAGFTGRDASYGAWNALSGVIHARLAEDLVPAPDLEALTSPWRRVFGTRT